MSLSKIAIELLGRVVEATVNGPGYLHTGAKNVQVLAEQGFVEVNQELVENGNPAVRATDAGIAHYNELKTGNDDMSAATATSTAQSAAVITGPMKDVPIPTGTRRGRQASSKYPFDKLDIGECFFVAATEEMPDPKKSLSSALTQARKRSAVETGEMTTNRKGEEVPEVRYTRDYVVRDIEDGEAFGFPGQAGAAVWRVNAE